MPEAKSGICDDEAAALLSAWTSDIDAAFEREAEKLLSLKHMNATLESLSGMTEYAFSIFEAVRNCAGTVTGNRHDKDGPLLCRTDLFAFTVQGSAEDVSNSMLGALPHRLADEMKNTGYVDHDSTIFIFTAPLDPDAVSGLTPDMIRWLTIQAHDMLISRRPEDVTAMRRALGAFQLNLPPSSRQHGLYEAIVIGARLVWTRQGKPAKADLLSPDLLDLDDDETQSRARESREALSQSTEKLLEEFRLRLVVMEPLNFSHALNECAARRIAGWFAIEAITLGLPYEGDVDTLYISEHGEHVMAMATFRQQLLGPIAVSRMLAGTDLESLALSITNDIDKIVFQPPSAALPGPDRTLN